MTAVFCTLCLLFGLPWPCLFWPAAFYLGRGVAQTEYRYIQAHGGHKADCSWWCGFIPSAWTGKSLLDWILPAIAGLTFLMLEIYQWRLIP